jgi:tetratricopeptide (TPR) repeat protein
LILPKTCKKLSQNKDSANNWADSRGVFRNIPFPRNQGFVGRDEQLDKLEEMLFSPSHQHKVAVTGLGGVGKTQVALEIAYRIQETRPECSIFWIPATNVETLEQTCLKIAEQLALPGLEEERADARKLLKGYLCDGNAGQWLLIFDNADDINMWFGQTEANTEPCSLSEYIPWSKTGSVLFTTRFRKIAAKLAKQNVIEIPAMDEAQATKLLSERLGDKSLLHQKEEVVLLLKELVYLPLAIVQAASYMNENCVSSIADYQSLLSGQEDGVIDLLSEGFEDDWRTHHNTNPVATTWLISFEQIQRTQPFAADILCFMASIEPADIPQSILPPAPTRKAWTEAIGTLRGYAFVSRRSAAQTFDLHRLVHLATRNWLRKNATLSKWTITALTRLEAIFPSDEHTNRDIWNEYLPHVITLLEREEVKDAEVEIGSTRYDLIFKLSMCLLVDGRVTEAVNYLEEHYDWHKRQFDESHPSRLVSQHELASAYQANGQIAQAVDLLEHVVMVEGKTLAEEDPDRLSSQHALGCAYQANGQIAQAMDLLEHVVKVKERTFTKDHPSQLASLLASQHALAHTYRANGQITQAVELLEHVVMVEGRTLAEEHPSRLASEHELAGAYRVNGQITQAVELLEHVVMVEGRTLAKEHPDRLASQCALASAYQANGQITQAVELLEHVAAMQDRTLAEEHPSQLAFQYALARAYQANGQTTQAVELLEHVVMVEGRTLAEEHPSRLASKHELAIAYQATGQITQAVELLEHVVMVQGRTLAKEHPSLLASQHALGSVYQANGQIKQAIELLEHVVMVEGRTLAKEHPSLLASQHVLASAYQANGQIKQAVELLEHVVMVEARTLAEEHPSRVTSQRALTQLLLQMPPRSATSNSLSELSTTVSPL